MKVIGGGMVARAFRDNVGYQLPVVFFASGVSNSGCVDATQFTRERVLLDRAIADRPSGYKVVYFGTCSVYDPAQILSPYVVHKRAMEETVLAKPFGVVFRLPQLAGKDAPATTLLRYFVDRIRSKEPLTVLTGAMRSIIDVEDVVKLVTASLIDLEGENAVVNIANPNQISVLELVREIQRMLNTDGNVIYSPGGSTYHINTCQVQVYAERLGIHFGGYYVRELLEKYYR